MPTFTGEVNLSVVNLSISANAQRFCSTIIFEYLQITYIDLPVRHGSLAASTDAAHRPSGAVHKPGSTSAILTVLSRLQLTYAS